MQNKASVSSGAEPIRRAMVFDGTFFLSMSFCTIRNVYLCSLFAELRNFCNLLKNFLLCIIKISYDLSLRRDIPPPTLFRRKAKESCRL